MGNTSISNALAYQEKERFQHGGVFWTQHSHLCYIRMNISIGITLISGPLHLQGSK